MRTCWHHEVVQANFAKENRAKRAFRNLLKNYSDFYGDELKVSDGSYSESNGDNGSVYMEDNISESEDEKFNDIVSDHTELKGGGQR